jgi:hypothetical protein
LVRIRWNVEGTLGVVKYSRKVFYDDLWNSYLEDCRGLVIDRDWNIVSLPFRKIYNYGIERNAPAISGSVTAVRKVNGFMLAVTLHNCQIVLSTTGSLDNDHIAMAREFIAEHEKHLIDILGMPRNRNKTAIFECVHPSDPHIIQERPGLYFLGTRLKDLNQNDIDYSPNMFTVLPNVHSVDSKQCTMKEVINDCMVGVDHEGYVVYAYNALGDLVSTKVKSTQYLMKKFIARCKNLSVKLDKNNFEEEYYPLIDAIQSEGERFYSLDEQSRLRWIENFLCNILNK